MSRVTIARLLATAVLTVPFAGGLAWAEKTYEMRMGNITSNDTQEQIAQTFIDLVSEKSDGRIEGKLYSSASLGSNDEVMRGLRMGSIQATLNPTGYLSQFVPQAGVLTLPWLFPGDTTTEQIENVTRIMKGETGSQIKEIAGQKGFHVVSLFGLGPNQIYLRELDDSLNGIEHLKGQRIRTIGGQEHTQTVNDWGSRAIHMSLPEVYTSIQQGVLDGFDLPAAVTVRLKYHEQAPNVLLTNHIVLTQYITVSKAWYDQLPEELKKAVDDAGREAESLGTEAYIKSQNEAIEMLRADPNIDVIEISGEQLDQLREANKAGVWETVVDSNPLKREMLEMLERDIETLSQ